MKAFLSRVNWRHVAGIVVTLAAAGAAELYNVKHVASVAVLTGLLTRIDLLLNPKA